MQTAQRLYEGVNLLMEKQPALISYMRTDGVSISNDAINDIRSYVKTSDGPEYIPDSPSNV